MVVELPRPGIPKLFADFLATGCLPFFGSRIGNHNIDGDGAATFGRARAGVKGQLDVRLDSITPLKPA